MWLFSEHHDCIFLKKILSHPNIISQPISYEVGVCFLCIQNAERTCTHKLWEATTDQWSSFQCICFWSMEKVLLVQEGLIQIANQTPPGLVWRSAISTPRTWQWSALRLACCSAVCLYSSASMCKTNLATIASSLYHACSTYEAHSSLDWEAGVILSLRQWKELSTNSWHLYKRTLPTVTSQVTTVTPWRGSGDKKEACSSRWDWWWNSSCKGRSGGKYLNIHSLMQSTDEVYSVVASGSFAHRKKEMFRK